jgi:hypothetical protein
VDSNASHSIKHPEARSSIESSETIYIKFDFEPELMTGRVYGRSYNFLAKNMAKKRGKEVLHNIEAELLNGRPDTAVGDDNLLNSSTFHSPGANVPSDQAYSSADFIPPVIIIKGSAWHLDDGKLSRSWNVSQQASPKDNQKIVKSELLDLEKWDEAVGVRYPSFRGLEYFALRKVTSNEQVSIYRPPYTTPLKIDSDASSFSYYIASVKFERSGKLQRGILDVDVVELQQFVLHKLSPWQESSCPILSWSQLSDELSSPQIPRDQEAFRLMNKLIIEQINPSVRELEHLLRSRHVSWINDARFALDELAQIRVVRKNEALEHMLNDIHLTGKQKALGILDELIRQKIENLDHVFRDSLTYLVNRLVDGIVVDLGEHCIRAVNECKEDIIANYLTMLRSRVSDKNYPTTLSNDLKYQNID